ncbi:uncharacterized protein BDZ99DRAFT_534172 [Mytilinidion resinicola]|uniref:Spindle pole body component n=1 Tax=Mytilinidion resinicola TaxID=574789 RepID=A0A6A6YHE2_9PEZI|nr:uncharacterized protein BDZ99DRAFT_534172 [Mytilinidion resinicola]KAF2808221.1 hypothetical protein BDZ99DRAFT_534172 [Mytilinidion resinicola]
MCRFELLSVLIVFFQERFQRRNPPIHDEYKKRGRGKYRTTTAAMLHEILLSLSGHPSPLFDSPNTTKGLDTESFPLLSPPEAELLSSIGALSKLHRQTREHASRISSIHPSTICRAVATAIASSQLAKFQQKILDVERRILKRDASTVGAYNIVPLAGIVGEFDEWTRLMEWLWTLENFMLRPGLAEKNIKGVIREDIMSSGAGIIDKLRQEAQTGYPDIEEAAVELGKVAETAWLRQLSTWVLYGRLPTFGTSDFFIQWSDDDEESHFVVRNESLPKFVSRQTAASMLFVGKSLNQIRSLESASKAPATRSSRASELELLPLHLQHLSPVTTPISSSLLSEAITAIRLSLSRNMLQHLLPLPKIIELLSLLQEFFLLGRGEFAVALITEADEKIRSRHTVPGQTSQRKQGLQGVLLKEGEITAVLARAWSVLSSLSGEEDHADDSLDLAMDLVHLSIHKPTANRPGTPGRARESSSSAPKISSVVFNDFLLSIPTTLTLDIRSPLDLFIVNSDLDIYSSINAYLLSVRRGHLRVADLWRQSSIRREHPAPPAPQFSSTLSGKAILRKRRQRADARGREMRKVWATCGAAIFFLSEAGAYFEVEVVQESWKHFRDWILQPESSPQRPPSSLTDRPRSSTDRSAVFTPPYSPAASLNRNINIPITERPSSKDGTSTPHDPETLASAHRAFLASLAYSLLLTDFLFTTALREFLIHVDELVAYITRLQLVQQNLDLEDDGIVDAMADYAKEEREVALQLDRARKRVDSDLKGLVGRLREVDAERMGGGSGTGVVGGEGAGGGAAYEPWRVGGVDRLLMKLDWGEEGSEDEEEWEGA